MKNVVVKGRISTMSNKNDSKFKQEVPTKTVYITVDEDNAKKLQEFGMTLYTSETDNEDFFIVKTSKFLSCYLTNNTDEAPIKFDMSVATGISYKTSEDIDIIMNVVSGENMGNVFYRLQAVRLNDLYELEEIKAANPFADME